MLGCRSRSTWWNFQSTENPLYKVAVLPMAYNGGPRQLKNSSSWSWMTTEYCSVSLFPHMKSWMQLQASAIWFFCDALHILEVDRHCLARNWGWHNRDRMEPKRRKTYFKLISPIVFLGSKWTKTEGTKNTYNQTSRLEIPEELQLFHNHEVDK
jgi:hypothetical protein